MNKAGLSPRKLVLSKSSPANKLAHQSVRNSVIEVVHQSPNSKSTTPSKRLEHLSPVRRSPRHPPSGGSTPKATPNKKEDHQTAIVSSPALRDTPERLKSRQAAQGLTPTKGSMSPLKEHNTKANAFVGYYYFIIKLLLFLLINYIIFINYYIIYYFIIIKLFATCFLL